MATMTREQLRAEIATTNARQATEYVEAARAYCIAAADRLAEFYRYRLIVVLEMSGHRMRQRERVEFNASAEDAAAARSPELWAGIEAITRPTWLALAPWFQNPTTVLPEQIARLSRAAVLPLVELLAEAGFTSDVN